MFLLQASDISIGHRWQVSMMCTLFRILQDIDGPLYSQLPDSGVAIGEARLSANIISRAFNAIEHQTGQFSRTSINIWNKCL